MSKHRRLLLSLIAAVLLPLAGLGVYLWAMQPSPGVTRDNFHRLHQGMALEEVEEILGSKGVRVLEELPPKPLTGLEKVRRWVKEWTGW